MAEVLLTAEALVAVVALVTLAFGLVLVRRRLIARDTELILSGLRLHGRARARTGLLRPTTAALEWYPLFGLTTRMQHRWSRAVLELGAPQAPEADRYSMAGLSPNAVQLTCHVRGRPDQEDFDLVVTRPSATALRAWAEAAPPPDWRAY